MSDQSILLAGWDAKDIEFFENEINELSNTEKVLIMPYSATVTLGKSLNNITLLTSISESEQRSKYHIPTSDEPLIGRIKGSEYEMLLILLARTGYVSLPLYEQIRHMTGLLNYFYDYLKNIGISKGSILVYRVIPHLYSDYCLALAANLLGCIVYVISPVKGVTGLLRPDQNSANLYYYVHELFTGGVKKLPDLGKENAKNVSSMLFELFQDNNHNGKRDNYKELNVEPYPLRERSLKNLREIRKKEKQSVCSGEYSQELNMLSNLKRSYELQCTSNILCNRSRSYIYFPLPKQPEASSQPFSGMYWDPIYWTDQLHKIFGDQIDIVLKEHPDTFRFPFKPNKHFLTKHNFPRTASLYKDLKIRHKNLHFVDTRISSEQIYRSSSCVGVFTMNGAALYQCVRENISVYMPKNHWVTMIRGVETLNNEKGRKEKRDSSITYNAEKLSKTINEVSKRIIRVLPNTKNYAKTQIISDIVYLLRSADKRQEQISTKQTQ